MEVGEGRKNNAKTSFPRPELTFRGSIGLSLMLGRGRQAGTCDFPPSLKPQKCNGILLDGGHSQETSTLFSPCNTRIIPLYCLIPVHSLYVPWSSCFQLGRIRRRLDHIWILQIPLLPNLIHSLHNYQTLFPWHSLTF